MIRIGKRTFGRAVAAGNTTVAVRTVADGSVSIDTVLGTWEA